MTDHDRSTSQDLSASCHAGFASAHRWRWFALVAVAVVAGIFIQRPSLTWRAEAWAETATNFYHHARNTSLVGNFTASDCGSLSWPLRIISVFLVMGCGFEEHFIIAVQVVSTIAIGLCCASLCLPWCDRLGLGVADRCILGIGIGWGAFADYQGYAAINAAYFAALPLIGICLQAFRADCRATTAVVLGVAAGVMITGKIHVLVFALPIGLASLWHLRHGRITVAAGLGVAQIFSGLQILAMTSVPLSYGGETVPACTLVQTLVDVGAHTTAVLYHVLFFSNTSPIPWVLTLGLFCLPIIIAFRRPDFGQDRRFAILFLMAGIAVIAALNLKAFPYVHRGYSITSCEFPGQIKYRHFYLMYLFAMLSAAMILAYHFRRDPRLRRVPQVLLVVMMFGGIRFHAGDGEMYKSRADSPSDWVHLIGAVGSGSGSIPINPEGWWYHPGGDRVLYDATPAHEVEAAIPSAVQGPVSGILVKAGDCRLTPTERKSIAITCDGRVRTIPGISSCERDCQFFPVPRIVLSGATIRMLLPNGVAIGIDRLSVVGP